MIDYCGIHLIFAASLSNKPGPPHFYVTREAALRVLEGADLASEAARIGQSEGFLAHHLRTLLMPILYS